MKSYLSDGSQYNNFVSGSNFVPGTAYVIFASNGTDFSYQGATGNQSGVLFIQSGGFGTGISGVASASVNNIHNASTVYSGDRILMPTGSFIWGNGGIQTILTKSVTLWGAGASTPIQPGGITGTIINNSPTANLNGSIILASACTVGNFNFYPTGGGGTNYSVFGVSNQPSNWRITTVNYNTNFITGGQFISGASYVVCGTSTGRPSFTDIGAINNTIAEIFTATGAGSGMVGGFAVTGTITSFILPESSTPPGSWGVIDNCYINGGGGTNEYIVLRGHTSGWQIPSSKGSNYALYVENCTFGGDGYSDMNACARAVFRYNLVLGQSKFDNHGACTNSLPTRSCRHTEIYNNAWAWSATGGTSSSTSMEIRGGSQIVFGNTTPNINYALQAAIEFKDYGYNQACGTFTGVWMTPLYYPILDQIGVGVDPLPWIISGSYVSTNYVQSSGYIFTCYAAVSNSMVPPNSDTGHWSGQGSPWVSGNTYTPGMYASVSGNYYLCVYPPVSGTNTVLYPLPPSGTIPSSDPFRWAPQGNNARIAASEPTYFFNNIRAGSTWSRGLSTPLQGVAQPFDSGTNGQGYPIGSIYLHFKPYDALNSAVGNGIRISGDDNRYLITGLLAGVGGTGVAIAYPGLLVSGTSGTAMYCDPNSNYTYQLQQICGHTGYAHTSMIENQIIQFNRDIFADASGLQAPFSGIASGGVGVGTFAQMMATTPSGFYSQLPVGWWVTGIGVGGWNSAPNAQPGQWGVGALGNPSGTPGGQLYIWNVQRQIWRLYYTPLAYPHPQVVGRYAISTAYPGAVVSIYQV